MLRQRRHSAFVVLCTLVKVSTRPPGTKIRPQTVKPSTATLGVMDTHVECHRNTELMLKFSAWRYNGRVDRRSQPGGDEWQRRIPKNNLTFRSPDRRRHQQHRRLSDIAARNGSRSVNDGIHIAHLVIEAISMLNAHSQRESGSQLQHVLFV